MFEHPLCYYPLKLKAQRTAKALARVHQCLDQQRPLTVKNLVDLVALAAMAYATRAQCTMVSSSYYIQVLRLLRDWLNLNLSISPECLHEGLVALNQPSASDEEARASLLKALEEEIQSCSLTSHIFSSQVKFGILFLNELSNSLQSREWSRAQKWALCAPYMKTLSLLAMFQMRQVEMFIEALPLDIALNPDQPKAILTTTVRYFTLQVELTTTGQIRLTRTMESPNKWELVFHFAQFRELYDFCQWVILTPEAEYEHRGHFWQLRYQDEPAALFFIHYGALQLQLTILEFDALFKVVEATYIKLQPYWTTLVATWGEI